MSIPYDTLHELAELFKPKLPIKSTSTWVAVLLHTKLNIKEIQEERDFMWVKCHDVSSSENPPKKLLPGAHANLTYIY